jgi:hypothetical protein
MHCALAAAWDPDNLSTYTGYHTFYCKYANCWPAPMGVYVQHSPIADAVVINLRTKHNTKQNTCRLGFH